MSGVFAAVTIDEDLHAGHCAGVTSGGGAGVERFFMEPSSASFGEGWRPERPQGSGKRNVHQVYPLAIDSRGNTRKAAQSTATDLYHAS